MLQKELDEDKKNFSKEKLIISAIIDESDTNRDQGTNVHKKIDPKFQKAMRKITRTS